MPDSTGSGHNSDNEDGERARLIVSSGAYRYTKVDSAKPDIEIERSNSELVSSKEFVNKNTNKSRFTARQWTTLIVLAVVNLGEAVVVSLQAPFYPAEAEKKGATATEYGLVFGVFELVIFCVSPIYGKYMMQIGPKFLLNAGILTTSICSILFGFLDEIYGREAFISLSFIIRIVQALGEAGYITACFTLIAKEFPDSIATTFASLETCFGIGILIGPTIGGALYQAGGYTLPFVTMGAFLFLGACVTFFILPNTENDEIHTSDIPGVFTLIRIPPVAISVFTTFSSACAIGYLSATLEPHLRDFKLSPIQNGAMFIISGGVYAVTAPIWGRLCDKSGQTKLFVAFASVSVCIAFSLLGPAPFLPFEKQLWLCIVALVFHGFGVGGEIVCAFLGSLKEAVKNGYPDDLRTYGLVSALWSSSFALGAFVGPSVGGLMLDTVGFRYGTLTIIIEHAILFILVVCYLLYRKYIDKKESISCNFTEESKRLQESLAAMSRV